MRLTCLLPLFLLPLGACDESRVPGPAAPTGRDGAVAAGSDAASTDAGRADTGPADSGPVPDGGISPLCNDYCLEEQFHCDPTFSFFSDGASCDAYCGSLPLGSPGDQTGDSLHCRLYWVGQPAAMDPTTNCPKAAPASTVCD